MNLLTLALLGSRFELDSSELALFDYTRAFLEAYAPEEAPPPAMRRVVVHLTRGRLSRVEGAPRIPIHKSKHRYWTFDGELLPGMPGRVVWSSKGIEVELTPDMARVHIRVAPDTPPFRPERRSSTPSGGWRSTCVPLPATCSTPAPSRFRAGPCCSSATPSRGRPPS